MRFRETARTTLTRRRSARLAGAAALAAALGTMRAGDADAHGEFPGLTSAAFGGRGDTELLLGTTFGALVSSDGGRRWELICEEAMGDVLPMLVAWTAEGIIAASWNGVFVSHDGGCSFAPVEALRRRGVTDLAVVQTDRRVIYVITGQSQAPNRLYRSADGGRSFAPTAVERTELLTSLALSPAAPKRVYVATWSERTSAALLRSDDEGASVSELPHPTDDPSSPVYVLGASPADADVVFTRTFTKSGHAIWRSPDGGLTFAKVLELEAVNVTGAITFSSEGTRVWLGSNGGLYRSEDGGRTFTPPTAPELRPCAAWLPAGPGAGLYACGDLIKEGDWGVARAADGEAPWEPLLPSLAALAGIRTCPATSPTTTTCTAAWGPLTAWLNIDVPLPSAPTPGDGRPSRGDAGAAPTGGSSAPRAGNSGCAFVPSACVNVPSVVTLVLLIGRGLLRRRARAVRPSRAM